MKKLILAVFAMPLLSACGPSVQLMNACPDHSGTYRMTLSYGAGGITTKAKKTVKKNSILVIKLDPDREYRETKVTTEGTSVTPTTPTPPDKGWLDESGNWKDDKKLIYCVPTPPEGTVYSYKYSITVEDLAFLDPRVDVTW